ncbi:MAG: PIN/TRAM domain-containing protein [Planctomycetota bacterium]
MPHRNQADGHAHTHGGQVDLSALERSRLRQDDALERSRRGALLWIVRVAFVTLVLMVTLLNVLEFGESVEPGLPFGLAQYWPGTLAIAGSLAAIFILIDLITPNKKLSTFSGILFGVLGGLIIAIALGFILDLVALSWGVGEDSQIINTIKVLFGLSLVFLGVTTVLQTQDDFRLVVPYVEFAKQMRGPRPLVLDSSALIDARIADVADTGVIQAPVVVPSFVVAELQALADSSDNLKRAKGRRGLEVIARLRRSGRVGLTIDETPLPNQAVDHKLVELARQMPGMLVTGDVALARIADIQNVPVLNLNQLANALKQSVIPGEELTVALIKPGEQETQAVGYLDDGTMVVAEDGAHSIGEQVTLTVRSSLQTVAGRMIFGRIGNEEQNPQPERMADEPETVEEVPAADPAPDPDPEAEATKEVTTAKTPAAPVRRAKVNRARNPRR